MTTCDRWFTSQIFIVRLSAFVIWWLDDVNLDARLLCRLVERVKSCGLPSRSCCSARIPLIRIITIMMIMMMMMMMMNHWWSSCSARISLIRMMRWRRDEQVLHPAPRIPVIGLAGPSVMPEMRRIFLTHWKSPPNFNLVISRFLFSLCYHMITNFYLWKCPKLKTREVCSNNFKNQFHEEQRRISSVKEVGWCQTKKSVTVESLTRPNFLLPLKEVYWEVFQRLLPSVFLLVQFMASV